MYYRMRTKCGSKILFCYWQQWTVCQEINIFNNFVNFHYFNNLFFILLLEFLGCQKSWMCRCNILSPDSCGSPRIRTQGICKSRKKLLTRGEFPRERRRFDFVWNLLEAAEMTQVEDFSSKVKNKHLPRNEVIFYLYTNSNVSCDINNHKL